MKPTFLGNCSNKIQLLGWGFSEEKQYAKLQKLIN